MGSHSSRPRHELAEDLFAGHSASGMGELSFMSADLFAYLLDFLEIEDACRLSSLNHFFHALLSPKGYAWRQFYIKSAFYEHEKFLEMDKSNDSNWKALCASNHRMGWQLDTSPLRCGEAFMLQKDLLGCVVDKTYKGPVLVQRVVTKRGVWRGRHLFSVRVEGYSPGSTSFGVCQGRHVPPHGYISAVGIFAGDGTLDTTKEVDIATPPDIRIKSRIRTHDTVTIDLDLDKHEVTFYVNGHKWVMLVGVTTEGEGSSKGPWFFYISIKNYAVPTHIPNSKTEQVYRIVPHPPLLTTEYSLARSSSSPSSPTKE